MTLVPRTKLRLWLLWGLFGLLIINRSLHRLLLQMLCPNHDSRDLTHQEWLLQRSVGAGWVRGVLLLLVGLLAAGLCNFHLLSRDFPRQDDPYA